MPRHGENIYKRRDGRYEGRYVVGKTATGKTKFGYVYGYQYTEVRNELLRKKTERLPVGETMLKCRRILLRDWLQQWLESEVSGSVKGSSYQTYLLQIQCIRQPQGNSARRFHFQQALPWRIADPSPHAPASRNNSSWR